LGAFGKSAQFPFHFWLPRAMEAPTPVSAYLHSATMVKLGVFLVARLYPVFSNAVLWMPVLMVVGFGTMCIAAYLALKSNQLKAILAYSTVTQLGCLTGLYGLQSVNGVFADAFHILDHVFYKACLFMVVGIVTHATGLKDLRDLGGLGRRMPVLAFATGVACASMAGLPLTMGFISKELLLEDFGKVMQVVPSFGWIGFVLFALASLMKVAFSFRLFVQMFLAPETEKVREHYHAPGWAFQLPPVLLAVASLLGGWWLAAPGALVRYLHVPGLQSRESYLAYWHGVGFELAMSLALLCAGLCLYLHGRGTQWAHNEIPHFLRFDVGFERLVGMFNRFTQWLTRLLRSESPVDYLLIILGVFALSCGGFLIQHLQSGTGAAFIVSDWRFEINPLRCFVALMIVIAALSVVLLRKWTSQLIMLSAAGFLITFYFVLYRAPDLALTQILVESATLILVLLLLARFPKSAQEGEDLEPVQGFRNVFNLLVSLAVGSTITMMILVAGALPPSQRLGLSHLEQTVPFAEGSNAVNTILVDFRGFDTLGEIAVLVIAILGAIGLFFRYKRSDQQRRQRALGAPGFGTFHTQPKPPEEVQ
ncbi:MAG: hydrogen gas-evolving membrane-bound hydrogenase subunit E, partial [Candidatus Methylacidiphilales bacterium]